ncbi:hypothetical protein H6P81_007997 [Aristolochia fimbriata]|uniref:C3H1-type domain-containing protein n=1 Tax=Aristolochia fimbriata TaxID=158543 RepID=A0AAV7F211_ARIFI|nr:hypothetical protein H6P81_007997 [Aristolochia fimbriata]
MPDNRQNKNNGVSASANASVDNLEEAMWRLKVQTQDGQDGPDSRWSVYPIRPGEPDCIYFVRTGQCGYGNNCRFNHPPSAGQATQSKGELPERVGQPDCQYFLKTGTCKFGASCKYHHPRDRHDAGQVPLNIVGLPIRQEEKSCSYYMRTGSCKFGVACKFNHPQPATLGALLPVTGNAPYGSTGSSTTSSGVPYVGGLPAWSLPRAPYVSGTRVQVPPAYMPVVISSSQGMIPAQPGWSTYTGALSPVSSSDGSNLMAYNSMLHHPGEPGSSAQLQLSPTSITNLPERPDEPECQYYMKTGTCKFGESCKYNHPKERNAAPVAVSTVGPLGLPLRPGQAICTFYGMYGICKYGSACKYDHPLAGYYNYILPALSIPDPSAVGPYQRTSPVTRSSPESSPPKTWKAQGDRLSKSEGTSTPKDKQNLNVVSSPSSGEDQSLQTGSSLHTAPTSEQSQEQSD